MADDLDTTTRIRRGLMPCLYYTYLAPVMPPTCHDKLQEKIQEAIDMLEKRKSMPSCLDVPPKFRPAPVKVLREWQHDVQRKFPAAKLRQSIVDQRRGADIRQALRFGEDYGQYRKPKGCEKQEMFYRHTAILLLSPDARSHNPELQPAYQLYDLSKPRDIDNGFLKEVDDTWKTNSTMIDLHWEKDREVSHADSNLAHDPFGLGHSLVLMGFPEDEKDGLFGLLKPLFYSAAHAIQILKTEVKIEACVGDITSILEQIRYAVVEHRPNLDVVQSVTDDPSVPVPDQLIESMDEYPKKYDRIHLSNIPDYVGGSLNTCVYGLQMLHRGDKHFVTFNCLRNPDKFKTFAHYNNEYTLLSTPSDLKKMFEVRIRELEEQEKANPFICTNYMEWFFDPLDKSSSTLMPRDQLELWLIRLFFKIAIPKDRSLRAFSLLYSPHNMTTFFRICGHLHTVGYPAHWMSGVLNEIYSGSVTTKARPPRSEPLQIKEVKKDMPAVAQFTKPFVSEMTTLGSLWQFALPFGVATPITPVYQIHKYTIHFNGVQDECAENPVFILAMFSARYVTSDIADIRPFLLDDDKADKSEKGKRIRENIHVISTWNWDSDNKTGMFWMRKDIMDDLKLKGDFAIAIWRTDVWSYQSQPEPLMEVRDKGPFWVKKGGSTPDPE